MTQVTRRRDGSRTLTLGAALAIAALLLAGAAILVGRHDSSGRYTDTKGNTWTCSQSGGLGGYPLVSCDGMQTLDRDPADGGVRGFLLPDGRVTFRPVRWGETPDTTTHVLEGTR